jgi:hypothetical protein
MLRPGIEHCLADRFALAGQPDDLSSSDSNPKTAAGWGGPQQKKHLAWLWFRFSSNLSLESQLWREDSEEDCS